MGPAHAHICWHTCMTNTCMRTRHTVILIGNKHQSVKCVGRKDVSLEEDTLIAVGPSFSVKEKNEP